MKKIKRIAACAMVLLCAYFVFGALITFVIVTENGEPVVYRSATTHEIVRVEIRGKIVPNSRAGKLHTNVWVK